MMLATLLLMPNEGQPRLLVIDEPEIGLHPAAITALSGMVATASAWTQIIVTTQSPALLEEFEADDVVVASRVREGQSDRYETRFDRLSEADLVHWEGYSLGELWDKNILGGRPAA